MISILVVLGLAVAGHAAGQTARGGQVRGVVVDVTGAGLAEAFVRLLQSTSNTLITRLSADRSGTFQTGTLEPGSYVLVAWAQGFRARRLSAAIVRDGETTDVGKVQLDLAGCDAPGVMCDTFGIGPPDPILVRGYLELKQGCGVDLRGNKSYCPDYSGLVRQGRAIDLRLTRDETGVYLNPVNGTTLSADCSTATLSKSKIRVDGLGRGDDICARTHEGLPSHVFLVDDAERDSPSTRLWHVTRKR